MTVLILFHCNIHASLFSFSCFLLVCLINLKKKIVVVYFFAVVIKNKPKNISRSSFACWELSRLNSFYFFSFLWGSRRPYWKCLVALICMIVNLTSSPYYLSSLLSWMLADSSLVQCTCTLIIIHIIRSCKWKAIMMIYDGLTEMRKAGMNSTSFVFVNMLSPSFLIKLIMNKHVCNDN